MSLQLCVCPSPTPYRLPTPIKKKNPPHPGVGVPYAGVGGPGGGWGGGSAWGVAKTVVRGGGLGLGKGVLCAVGKSCYIWPAIIFATRRWAPLSVVGALIACSWTEIGSGFTCTEGRGEPSSQQLGSFGHPDLIDNERTA